MKERIANACDMITEYCLYVIIFFIPISKAAIEIFFAFAFVAFILRKILKPDFKFMYNPLHFLLLLFFLFSGLSLFNSGPYLLKSFIALLFKWGKYIALFIIAEDTIYTAKRLRNALAVFLISGFIVGMDGIFQNITGIDFLRHKKSIPITSGGYGITASFNHYNDFGSYLVVILSLLAALLLSKKLKKSYLFCSLINLVLLVLCLLFTFSRGAWLSTILAFILMVFLLKKNKSILISLCIFMLILILTPVIRERLLFIFDIKGDADRFAFWRVAFLMIKDNPFLGRGLGLFMDYFKKYEPNLYVHYAHNCYLQVWAESGVFSFLSFLSFLVLLFRRGIMVFNRGGNFILLGLLSGLFGFLFHSFFDTQLYSLQLSFLFWLMAGILSSFSNTPKIGNINKEYAENEK